MIKYVLLDIDNTLLDFDSCTWDAFRQGFIKFGIGTFEDYMMDEFHKINSVLWGRIEEGTLTLDELKKIRFCKFFEKMNIDADGVEFEYYFRDFIYDYAVEVTGAMDLLKYLSSKYILASASNGPYNQQIHRLSIAGMDKYISFNFISEKLGVQKPNKLFFEKALNEMKTTPDECIMIGDSLSSDIKGGKSVNMKTIYYNKHNSPVSPDAADYIIYSLDEIKNIL